MGIKGIYQEIGPGARIALSKLAVQTYEQKGRPLRLAIDISIWLFQIQASKGGTNPALRTFYYRLLRLVTLAINPLFVYDGPNKPPFKRNKRTGPNVASIPEFLSKQLLKQFGLPFHIAPGEAEAECALLQQKGIVDAVLSEDVDTLMFGSRLTLRNWSSNTPTKGTVPTHVNMYNSDETKAGPSGLDREGMILVALMSGGDYIPEGIPGCGPKIACQAARAGFGAELCGISRRDNEGITKWRERLMHELRTNESKFFKAKHPALVIPEDFPRRDILRYYTHPCLSSEDRIEALRASLTWQSPIDILSLRTFTSEAFDWVCLSGAKKFIRNIAPALLVKTLVSKPETEDDAADDVELKAERESTLVKKIYRTRNHPSTDEAPELRIDYVPNEIVKLDLEQEEPDPAVPTDQIDPEEDDVILDEDEHPTKKRNPSTYNPSELEKIWIMETFLKVGVPLKIQDWEESQRAGSKSDHATKAGKRIKRGTAYPVSGGMPSGAIQRYTTATKPSSGAARKIAAVKIADMALDESDLGMSSTVPSTTPASTLSHFDSQDGVSSKLTIDQKSKRGVNLVSSTETKALRAKRPFQRSQSDTRAMTGRRGNFKRTNERSGTLKNSNSMMKTFQFPGKIPEEVATLDLTDDTTPRLTDITSLEDGLPTLFGNNKTTQSEPSTPKSSAKTAARGCNRDIISLLSSPATPTRQKLITDWTSPQKQACRAPTLNISTDVQRGLFRAPLAQKDNQPSRPVPKIAVLDCTEDTLIGLHDPPLGRTATDIEAEKYSLGATVKPSSNTIVLRQSFDGAWGSAGVATGVDNATEKNEKKRKRTKDARTWRVSQVEVLDLS